jgi:endo-1,4-beta-D-glucanase Y
MTDPTEAARRERLAEINTEAAERAALEARYGQVWDTKELARDFVVIGFLAPILAVRRKSDGARGSLEFQNRPRYYFNFQAH